MTREHRIEARAQAQIEALGCLCPKWGTDGWPDRVVMLPGGGVLWIEFKKPVSGRLEAAQKVRRYQLKKIGHTLHVATTVEQAVKIVVDALRSLDRSAHGDPRPADPEEVLPLGEAGQRQDGGDADGG